MFEQQASFYINQRYSVDSTNIPIPIGTVPSVTLTDFFKITNEIQILLWGTGNTRKSKTAEVFLKLITGTTQSIKFSPRCNLF
jgi:hypothetical protein